MTRRLRRILALFTLAAALLPASAAAVPADTTDPAAVPVDTIDAPAMETDAPAVEKAILLRLLNADSTAKQERALRLIGTYARSDRYDEDFFRVLVTPLHGLVATGETEAIRIMAVSALSAIGTEPAMDGLKAQVDGLTSRRVQRLTRYAIAQYEINRTAATTNSQKR